MELFVLLLGFIGAWLLFAGPIYQAALELKEEDIEFERIRTVRSQVDRPPAVSVWWWIVPPAKIILERKRAAQYRKQYVQALSAEDTESLINFMSKATAWLYVAVGGFCLAIKETYELTEHQRWNIWIFWLLMIVMVLVSISNLISRLRRAKSIVQSSR